MISVYTRICRSLYVAAFSFLLSPLFSYAADMSQPASVVSPISSLFRMLFGLGVVLVIIGGMVWLLKRMTPGQTANSGGLRVVSAVAVGPKERVVLVDVGETRLVLGVAPGHVVRLLEMERPDESEIASNIGNTPSFVTRLKEVVAARGIAK
jgi:flagellar protein FliO/FliZ